MSKAETDFAVGDTADQGKLTKAKKNQSDRIEPQPAQNPYKQHNDLQTHRLPVKIAAGLSVIWVIIATAYFMNLSGAASLEISPANLATYIAGLATPIAVIWLITLAFQRTDPLLERRLDMSQNLHKAVAPVEEAERRLNQLSKNLGKELDNIVAVADLASDRIENLENRFQAQISDLFSATADTEARTAIIRETLSRERGQIETLTSDISQRFEQIESLVDKLSHDIDNSSNKAVKNTESARSQIDQSINLLSSKTEELENRIAHAGDIFTKRSHRAQSMAIDTENRVQNLTDHMIQGLDSFKTEMIGLEKQSANLSDNMKAEAATLHEMADMSAREVERIEKSLSIHLEDVRTSTRETLNYTSEISDTFAINAKTMSSEATLTADAVKVTLTEVSETLKAHCEAALETSTAMLDNTANQAAQTGAHVRNHASIIDELLSKNLKRAHETLMKTATAISEHSNNTAKDAESASERTIQHIRQLRTNVEEQIEELANTSDTVFDRINETVGDMSADISGLQETSLMTETTLQSAQVRIGEQSSSLNQALIETHEKLETLEEGLVKQRDVLSTTASQAISHVLGAAEQFSEQSENLKTQASEIHSDMSHQTIALTQSVEQLSETSVSSVNALTNSKNELSHETQNLQAELTDAENALSRASTAFASERTHLRTEADGVVKELNTATDHMADQAARLNENVTHVSNQLDNASQTLFDETSRAQTSMQQAVSDATGALSTSMADLSTEANRHINFLREDMRETLDHVLHHFVQTASLAGDEGLSLVHKLENEAKELATRAEDFINRTAMVEERLATASKNDFAKSAHLLQESLQSSAIDIHKYLALDLPDSAWDSYLKGDKSLFMRRTVKIVDKRAKKIIAEKYKHDKEFKETVSRYFRDFEGMMERASFGDRGSALSVTLISSDMGKLYVLLSQSLKRFN